MAYNAARHTHDLSERYDDLGDLFLLEDFHHQLMRNQGEYSQALWKMVFEGGENRLAREQWVECLQSQLKNQEKLIAKMEKRLRVLEANADNKDEAGGNTENGN